MLMTSLARLHKHQALRVARVRQPVAHPTMRGASAASLYSLNMHKRAGTPARAADGDASLVPKPSALPSVGGSAAVYKAVTAACFGAFLFGYHLGIVNGPLQQIATDLNFSTNVGLQGLVVSISLAGAAVGSLSGSVLADSLGRVKALIGAALPLLIGAAVSASASGVGGMLAGRFAVGVGIGLSSAAVPLYISEVAPTKIRGTLGSVNQLMICLGILGALLVNVALPVTAWRTMFWLASIPAVALIAGMLVSPETPAFLLSKGSKVDAESSAERLWGRAYKSELYGSAYEGADEEIGKMQMEGAPSTQPEAAEQASGLFDGINGKLILIACALFVFQQGSGINAIVYFSSSVFKDAGVGGETLASAAVGVVNVLGTIVAASLMDKQGRKRLLSFSLAGQGLCMLVMAVFLGTPALADFRGPVALIFTLLYVVMFALGTGPVPGLLCAELLPVSIRGKGVSIALGVHWICNFMVGQLFLSAVAQVGVSGVYCIFAAFCALGVAFMQTFLVETKGRSPEEIMKLMR